MHRIIIYGLLCLMLVGCNSQPTPSPSPSTATPAVSESAAITTSPTAEPSEPPAATTQPPAASEAVTATPSGSVISSASPSGTDMATQVKDYILNGQDDKPEAEKLKWNGAFLERVDMSAMLAEYIKAGGVDGDVEAFALYITENAPIMDEAQWQQLARDEINKVYDEEIVRFEHIEKDLYQVYITVEGDEVPFVVISARTGNWHG